jgi:hypothetical protein
LTNFWSQGILGFQHVMSNNLVFDKFTILYVLVSLVHSLFY